jgi:hypothetical protein
MLEDFDNRGIMDDRDVDYLEHLDVPTPEVDDVAMEGIIRAVAHDVGSVYTDTYRELKGWFLGIESKRKYIEEICIDLIDWLKDKDADERNLNLDMGSFKTWMKTSESFFWRFYFLLNVEVWRNIENDLKKGEISQLESIYGLEFKDRVKVTRYLDSIDNIPDLIKVVETYIKRSNRFFELITQRKVKVKMAPFQVILLGAADLRRTVKKIVNLAI